MGALFSSTPEWSVAGKHVLVTGASSGIGAELARRYAKQGANLALVARGKEHLKSVANECKNLGSPKAMIYKCDMTENNQIKSAVEAAVQDFGRLDVVVLNAGRSQGCYFEEIRDVNQIDYMIKLNVNGVINALHYLLPSIPKSSSSRIVIVSSVSGLFGVLYRTIYCASKHALMGFAGALRVELGDTYCDNSPAVCILNFPEVSGTKLNTGRMNFGASKPPVEFDPTTASSLDKAIDDAVAAIASGKRESGQPLKVSILLPFYRIFPKFLDAMIVRSVKKNHALPEDK